MSKGKSKPFIISVKSGKLIRNDIQTDGQTKGKLIFFFGEAGWDLTNTEQPMKTKLIW
jgi:hypothetical protein